MSFFKEIFSGKSIFHAALILISVAFVSVFSYSTSFLYSLLGGDSAIFQVVGKYWVQGYLPYVDLFDHKGSLIFFVNALGYMIHPRTGVMVPQIISLYLSCLFVWRAMELYSRGAWKIFFLLLTLIYYAAHYEEGNHVSEYSLVFLSAAAYCFLRSLKENTFPPRYAFVYGLGLGACFLIRLSDAAQICCQSFLVAIFLLQSRAFGDFWRNFLSFCAGFASIVLPFAIYFAAHGALYEAFYGTFLLNVVYAVDESHHLEPFTRTIHALVHYLPFFALTIVGAFALKENPKNRLAMSGLFIGAMMALMLLSLRSSDQYAMIFLAVAPILFALLCESNDLLQRIWHARKFSLKRLLLKVLIFFAAIDLCIFAFHLKGVLLAEEPIVSVIFSSYRKWEELRNSDERQNILRLRALIPDEEKDSFACWGAFVRVRIGFCKPI